MLLWIKYNLKMKRFLLFFIIIFQSFTSHSKVVLPDFFSDNMVLQQKSTIKLWGIAKPRKTVRIKVSWSDVEYKYATKKDGNWEITIETPAASFEAQTITFSDGQESCLSNILIGEVWFCSGQSNMEMTFSGLKNQPIEGAEEIIKNANAANGIRMLRVKRNSPELPVSSSEGKWMLSTDKNVLNFSAIGYFYALSLREKLNVPIGIINSSWGGSSIEGWMNKELVDKYIIFDPIQIGSDELETHKKPSVMYNGMLYPYINYAIKGFLWYQGESNVARNANYANKMSDLVNLWRTDWNLGELPFYFVEIAPYQYEESVDPAKLREEQFKATSLIANSGIVCTNDLVRPEESNSIHPAQKRQIGERLANLALKNTYGFDTLCANSPAYESMAIVNNQISLKLTNCLDGIQADPEISGFEVAGADKIFYPGFATISEDKQSIIVLSPNVLEPVAVRYCFKNFLIGNVRNSCGLPLFGFRTDAW